MFEAKSVQFDSMQDALVAIDELEYIIDEKGYITVRDWKEQGITAEPASPTDTEYGWRYIGAAKICSVGPFFYIRLPRPERINNYYKKEYSNEA